MAYTVVRLLLFLITLVTFVASYSSCYAELPCECDHSYFGSPKEGVPFTWEMPELAYNRLLKQADQKLFSDKQYFWCDKTFSALIYSNGTGFRFLVCPRSWSEFTPKRLSRNELNVHLPSLDKIEALIDDPTAVMGGITVRVTASLNGGMMGPGQRTPGMNSGAAPSGG